MTDTPTTPPAGWYPAPDGSAATWWWDGVQWIQPQQELSPQPQQELSPDPAATGAIAKLATAVQVLLIVSGALSVVTIGVELFGIAATTEFLSGRTSSVDMLDAYDLISRVVAIVWTLVFIAAGVLWVIWQYRVAKQVVGHVRRSPGWHAGSWFIPVVSLWFPYQNISDLWRAIGRTRPSWLIVWWVLWIANSAVSQISARTFFGAVDLEQYRTAMYLSVVGELLSVAAVPLAWLVVRGITQGIVQRSSGTTQSTTLSPAADSM